MKKSNYKQEIDDIQASKEWKQEMQKNLYERQAKKRSKNLGFSIITVGCLVLFTLGVWNHYVNQDTSTLTSEHPKDTLALLNPNQNITLGSMGYEAIMQINQEDMKWDSPWDFENGIRELPVYKNKNPLDTAGFPRDELSFEQKEQLAMEYANRFNFTSLSFSEKSGEFLCDQGSIKIEHQSVSIWFSQAYMKQEDTSLLFQTTSDEEAINSLKQAYTKYEQVFDFHQPVFYADLSYHYHEENGKVPMRSYEIYEGEGSQVDQLVERSFRFVSFYADEANQLYGMRFKFEDLSTVIGNYPIVDLEEAKERLMNGQYSASAPLGDFNEIVHVQLVYNTIQTNEYFMPYYKFYAPLVKDAAKNRDPALISYGAYYVPAIETQYLQELPQQNSFYQ